MVVALTRVTFVSQLVLVDVDPNLFLSLAPPASVLSNNQLITQLEIKQCESFSTAFSCLQNCPGVVAQITGLQNYVTLRLTALVAAQQRLKQRAAFLGNSTHPLRVSAAVPKQPTLRSVIKSNLSAQEGNQDIQQPAGDFSITLLSSLSLFRSGASLESLQHFVSFSGFSGLVPFLLQRLSEKKLSVLEYLFHKTITIYEPDKKPSTLTTLHPLLRGLVLKFLYCSSPTLPMEFQDCLLNLEWKNHVSNVLGAWEKKMVEIFPSRFPNKQVSANSFSLLSISEAKEVKDIYF